MSGFFDDVLAPFLPGGGNNNDPPRPSTTPAVSAPPNTATLTRPQSTRTQPPTSQTPDPTTSPTTTLQTTTRPQTTAVQTTPAQTTSTTTRQTTPANQPSTMTTIPSPAPAPTAPETQPANPATTPLDIPPASSLTSDPTVQTTPPPQASGTVAPVTGSGSTQETIAGLPKMTFIGIACGVAGLILLLFIVFMVRRTLRSRREGNRQVLDRLDLTIGTSEPPVAGGSAKPGMTRSMEDLNRTWNAGLEQYHQPSISRANARGLGYSM